MALIFKPTCLMYLLLATTPFVCQIWASVVINEIHYDPDESASAVEFIELYNSGNETVNLAGWHFGDGISYTFPEGTEIGAQGYVLVVQGVEEFMEKYAPTRRSPLRSATVLGPFEGRLNNDGERLSLCGPDGEVKDQVEYRMGFPWPIVGEPVPPELPGNGPSIQLVHASFDNKRPECWRAAVPTPAQSNDRVMTTNHPTRFREKARHRPQQPRANEEVAVTMEMTDPNGIRQVVLEYQVVLPGHYIPLRSPRSILSLNHEPDVVSDIHTHYSAESNWQQIQMNDQGAEGDILPGDNIYTTVIPGQSHRSLVRYRIIVTDTEGQTVAVPYPEDLSMNYAYFVYNGVPNYEGISSEIMESLPVYHLITRWYDFHQALAWDHRDRMIQGNPEWFVYNWYGTIVYDGVVYDNIRYRLRGGNARYIPRTNPHAKRRMRFRFNRDHYFQAKDANGNPYPTKWRTLTTHNSTENRHTLTYGFNEHINFLLFNRIGIPAPYSYYFHLRVIDDEQEAPDPWRGDFWGTIFAQETYDSRFLEAHDLPKGNLYKLINSSNDAKKQQRYQAPNAVRDGADFDHIRIRLNGSKSASYIEDHVCLREWNRYHALCQAVRHYDWPRHQPNKNATWYFEPDYIPENNYYGKMWTLPYDTDVSWGPNWNNGEDVVFMSVFSGQPDRDAIWTAYYNEIREIRDLLWQREQIEPFLDYQAAKIKPMIEADRKRWYQAPFDAGSYDGLGGAGIDGLDALVRDMKYFAFVGGNWTGGSVQPGGRAAFLDGLADRTEGKYLPYQPSINYVGEPGYVSNRLAFAVSPFSDPQGDDSFAGLKWRLAQVDPNQGILEIETLWQTELNQFITTVLIPGSKVKTDHVYRVRCKMKDDTGRWSHWSEPIQFTAGTPQPVESFTDLRITELMYHPIASVEHPEVEDNAFEFIELHNAGSDNLDLSTLSFIAGVRFDFKDASIDTLAPGQFVLIVRDVNAFELRYGSERLSQVAGQYQGRLSNGGETIVLSDFMEGTILEFTYDDAWYPSTDGAGFSLVAQTSIPNNPVDLNIKDDWRPSLELHGTPGRP